MPSREHPLCFWDSELSTWEKFAEDVTLFRKDISSATHVCNLFTDRYDFMVALAASTLNNQVTVLPTAITPNAIQAALEGSINPLILNGKLQRFESIRNGTKMTRSTRIVEISDLTSTLLNSNSEIHVFTSGSTKVPERQIKYWKTLINGASVTAEILRRLDARPNTTAILGTTSHQHMYSLEAIIFLALGFEYCVHRSAAIFPADIENAVAAARASGFEKVVLVTCPAHLRLLESTLLKIPEICGIISAAATLSQAQAKRLEGRGDLAVMEIYGSTETGALAIRRTIEGNIWEPLAGFQLQETADGVSASAAFLLASVELADEIEVLPDGRFRLHGRKGDMICIAGKRANLSALNAILIETPGLHDGVVLCHRTEEDDQLEIVAVLDKALGFSETEVKSAIRKQFYAHADPIFFPRRITFIDSLPRTSTGKITAENLSQMT